MGILSRNMYWSLGIPNNYFPPTKKRQQLIEIKDTPINLGENKTTEKTGMGDSKHATTMEVSVTPNKTDSRMNRFERPQVIDSIEGTLITDTQITLPLTVPYGGSSINDALLEAIEELESEQVVPAIEDMMETEEDDVIVESTLLDHDIIMMLRESMMTLKKAMIKDRKETDEKIERLRQEVKEGKIGCVNCKKDVKRKGVERKKEERSIPYIPMKILKKEEVPTLQAPVIRRDWNEKREEWIERIVCREGKKS